MTVRIERSFRNCDYVFGVTSEVIHERCIPTGVEKIYKRFGSQWSRTKNAKSLYSVDFVQDRELKSLLDEIYDEACAREGR